MSGAWTEEDSQRCAETLRALRSAKPPAIVTMTTPTLVRKLAGDVWTMRREGFSWESIAAALRETGVTITATTLRSYLRGTHEAAQTKAAAKKRKQRLANAGSEPKNPAMKAARNDAANASTKKQEGAVGEGPRGDAKNPRAPAPKEPETHDGRDATGNVGRALAEDRTVASAKEDQAKASTERRGGFVVQEDRFR